MKSTLMDKALTVLLLIVALLYVLLVFFPSKGLETAASLIIGIIIIWNLPSLRGTIRVITYSLFVSAIIIFIVQKTPSHIWMEGLRVNLTLVTIFIFVPLLGIPIRIGGYLDSLKIIFKLTFRKSGYLFLSTQLLTHVLAVVLNIGSVSIVHFLSKASPIQSPRLLASAITRGFGSAIYWSPYFAAVALVLSGLELQWSSIVVYSLGFGVTSLAVSLFSDRAFLKSVQLEATEVEHQPIEPNMLQAKRKLTELFLLLIFMMGSVVVIEMATGMSMVMIICLTAVIFPLLWSVLRQQFSGYRQEVKNHLYRTLPNMKKEIVLFFIAGFFSKAFVQTEISGAVVQAIANLVGGSTIGAAYCILLIIVFTSIAGLHPIVTVTILVTSFEPSLLGMSESFFAVLLLGSWGISNTLSPATAVNNLLANLWRLDIADVSYRWNIKYACVLGLLLPIYLTILPI